jgi:hypothetical protein
LARDNYSYQKYKRELAKKRKKEEKIQHKLNKKNIQLKEGSGQVSSEDAAVSSYVPPVSPLPPYKETP